jgi:hypothetical protein
VTKEMALRRGRRRVKGSKGTLASLGGQWQHRFGRRSTDGGAISGNGARACGGKWRWFRRARAPYLDSSGGEVEEGEAER